MQRQSGGNERRLTMDFESVEWGDDQHRIKPLSVKSTRGAVVYTVPVARGAVTSDSVYGGLVNPWRWSREPSCRDAHFHAICRWVVCRLDPHVYADENPGSLA